MAAVWLACIFPLSLHLADHGRSFIPHEEPAVTIDLRSESAFARQHLTGASSLPIASLQDRLYELPPPGEWPLALIGGAVELAEARSIISPKGWEFVEYDSDDPTFWNSHLHSWEQGSRSRPTWRPNSFLAALLREVELPASGAALDIGCGSGRDAVWMSQHLGSEWDVMGLDNHDAALARACTLGDSCSGSTATFKQFDVRKNALRDLSSRPIRFVHGCRFLDRSLLSSLPELMAPGGLVAWSTFMNGDSPPQAPPFRPSRRLDRGELRQTLGIEAGFEVIADIEGVLLTRGTWECAQFYVARRV